VFCNFKEKRGDYNKSQLNSFSVGNIKIVEEVEDSENGPNFFQVSFIWMV